MKAFVSLFLKNFKVKKWQKLYFLEILLAIAAAAVASPEAEAEADPQLLYAGAYGAYPYAYGGYYGHYPYAYYGLGGKAAPCVNSAGAPVPCAAYNGYAKRDAEADPAADAYYAYYGGYAGYYGHPYGYGYGLYGHPGYYGRYGYGLKSAPCVNALNQPVPCA